MVRVGKGGGSAPLAAAPERVGPPASQWVAGAARGEAEALYELGWCYHSGEGVPQSYRYERAAALYQQAAAKGHAGAQTELGWCYRNGEGVPQSYERAAELFQQAAATGHAGAQDSLADLYRDGEGVPQSCERAAELYQQAASQGEAGAQFSLGLLYRDGVGVPKDVARAVALFKQAAAGEARMRPTPRGRSGWARPCHRGRLVRQGHPFPWTDGPASARGRRPQVCARRGGSPSIRIGP
jgi:TPR repeat protein